MLNEFLESLKNELELSCQNTGVELFLRDISQYKYISQKPVIVINFKGADLFDPPHASVSGQKADLSLNFYCFSRTLDNAYSDGIFDIFENIRAVEKIIVQSLKVYSHKKNVSVWEIKARLSRLL
jgi:hypothetical protein